MFLTLADAAKYIPGADEPREASTPWDKPTLSDRINTRMLAKFSNKPCVYFIGNPAFVKIGFTTNVARRFADLDAMSPFPLSVLLLSLGSFTLESDMHERFGLHSIRGEWFWHDGKLAEFIACERVKFA